MSGFTPGPWLCQSPDDDGMICIVGANLGGLVGAALCWPTEVETGGSDRVRANSQLIASAPELLEALEETWRVLRAAGLLNLTNGVQLGQTSWYVKICDAERMSDAALTKATGQSVVQSDNGGGV